MKVSFLTAEIGSTTTVLTAFSSNASGKLEYVGQGESYTTVNENDIIIGIERAMSSLKKSVGEQSLDWEVFLASSSAAGGLKMTVHGLVYEMTVRAAREAALGAGGVIKLVTAGKLSSRDVRKVSAEQPRLILLAGGVDFGEEETVIHNAHLLRDIDRGIPIVYAGNKAAAEEIMEILSDPSRELYFVENVYPRIDELNVEPTRRVIREVFSKNIVKGPGMEKIYSIVNQPVIPTPASVMLAAELLAERMEDVLVVDIGGATTDVDSVTDGDPEISRMLISPEPRSKRTVEGDLGVFVNASHVVDYLGIETLEREFSSLQSLMKNISPYPETVEAERFAARLGKYCFETSIRRHAGHIRNLYGPTGRVDVAYGKDLTAVKSVIGTGGILSRSRHSSEIMGDIASMAERHQKELLPGLDVRIFRDRHYIFAALGLLSTVDHTAALDLIEATLEEL
jgi:uncharacterized protein (TIGR01319 family)